MSLYRLFQSVVGRLKRRHWGTQIEFEDKPPIDTGVEPFAQELYQALSSDAPIPLSGPLKFTRNYSGPAFLVSGSESAVGYVASDGTTTGSNLATIRVHILTIEDDTLTVEDSNGLVRTILKPHDLRRSSFDKKTIDSIEYIYTGPQTRTASGTVQVIKPPYTFADEITAVLVEDGETILGPNGEPILYIDMNEGAKTWQNEDTPTNPADNLRWRIASINDYSKILPTIPVTGASNTTPIVVTVVGHGLQTGEHCILRNIEGNEAANGEWEVDAKTNLITNATNASPIVITTAQHHRMLDGVKVRIFGVRGNTAANNTIADTSWYFKYVNDVAGSLWQDAGFTVPVVGNGTYDSDSRPVIALADTFTIHELQPHQQDITDATNTTPIEIEVVGHGFVDNSSVIVLGVEGNTNANNTNAIDTWVINVTDADHFELVGSEGNAAYTGGGTVQLAFENFLDAVSGSGSYVSETGEMLVPARLAITATTLAEAQAVGFRVGLGIRMRTTAGRLSYGVITGLPSTEAYPYHRPSPIPPVIQAGQLTFAGPILRDDLAELAVGDPALVVQQVLLANFLPHYGSQTQLPISQLVQNTPPALVNKWRAFGGGTILNHYGRSLAHWYGPAATCVAFAGASNRAPNVDDNPGGAFSGGTVTIIPDRERPLNAVGLHTDGSIIPGSFVTRSSSFAFGHAVTGLRGWLFHKQSTGASPPTRNTDETTVIADGGTGTDFQKAITSSTDASPIVVTCVDHGLSDGLKITISGHTTNVAANGVRWVNKLTDDTFELYSNSTLSTPVAGSGAGDGSGGYFTNGLAATECVLESMTMEAVAGTLHWFEDFAQAPFINIDIGGQLLSPAHSWRGLRMALRDNVLNYNSPSNINPESADVEFNSRIDIACLGLGNRPGGRTDSEGASGASQYLTVFLVFVVS